MGKRWRRNNLFFFFFPFFFLFFDFFVFVFFVLFFVFFFFFFVFFPVRCDRSFLKKLFFSASHTISPVLSLKITRALILGPPTQLFPGGLRTRIHTTL
jgi:hypothetical protein